MMYRLSTMQSVTDRQTDRQTDDIIMNSLAESRILYTEGCEMRHTLFQTYYNAKSTEYSV